MALDGEELGQKIYEAIISVQPAAENPAAEALWKAIGPVIVDYFQQNADVDIKDVVSTVPAPIPVAVVPATGIGATTGPGSASHAGLGKIL